MGDKKSEDWGMGDWYLLVVSNCEGRGKQLRFVGVAAKWCLLVYE